MSSVMLHLIVEQFKTLPVLVSDETCGGKTYIVTGSNVGLGLETARHLVSCSAARVILAVRNVEAGEKAKTDIERSTSRSGVIEVWRLDLASSASVKAFAERASTLERIDAFVANAGIFLDQWTLAEGTETSMAVNVINTVLLAVLVMPKMTETAKKFGVKPRITFVVSALAFTVKGEMAKGGKVDIFSGLNNPKTANLAARYPLTKLVETYAVREFAARFPVKDTGVIINMTAPGLCSTSLGRDAKSSTRAVQEALRAVMARTAEQGSRTLLHGIVADEETHGKFLSGCLVKEHWIPNWMTDAEGQRTQKQVWKELVGKLESVQPGCTTFS